MLCLSISSCSTWLALRADVCFSSGLVTPELAAVRWMVVPVAISGLFDDLRMVNRPVVDIDGRTVVGLALNVAMLANSRANVEGKLMCMMNDSNEFVADSGYLHPF